MPIIGAAPVHFQHGLSHRSGGSDYFRNTTEVTMGIANIWSIACWVKAPQFVASTSLFEIKPSANSVNRISLAFSGTAGNILMSTFGSGGAAIKAYTYNTVSKSQQWQHIIFTWDGATLLAYFNGALKDVDSAGTDNAGTMTDTTRSVAFGATVAGGSILTGWTHSAAVWNVVLTGAEAALLYNNGNGASFDCRTVQQLNLKHWWLCDRGDSTRGQDYGFASTLIDISTNGVFGIAGSTSGTTDAPRQLIQTSVYYGHKYCLDFDGATEWMRDETTVIRSPGIASTWTTMMWIKPMEASFASQRVIWGMGVVGSNSRILQQHEGSVANDPFNIITNNTTSTIIKSYRFNNLINSGLAWQQICITWDGTILTVYSNGSAVSPSTTPSDNAGAMADAARIVQFGADVGASFWLGRLHTAAIWGEALTAGQISSLYNSGTGWSYDIRQAASAQPVHWWLFGDPYYGLVYDRIDSSPGNLMDPSASQATALTIAGDSVADYPGL